MKSCNVHNVLTIDVEDYFQVAALAESISFDQWDQIPTRVKNNTYQLLDLFDQYKVKATHFILGWVAERHPEIVKEIQRRGHEVASHGYSHQLIYQQTPTIFRQETERSKKLLEDITGDAIYGYRAASYSVTKDSLWALDIIAETGFQYDSSIFPIRHDRYGIHDSPTEPHRIRTPNGQILVEYPLSTEKVLGQTVPIAGGGYFRLYPYWLSRWFYRRRQKRAEPFVFYLHPWEIDAEQPRVNVSWFSRFRHYNNLTHCENRLSRLLSEFPFTTMRNHLEQLELFDIKHPVTASYAS